MVFSLKVLHYEKNLFFKPLDGLLSNPGKVAVLANENISNIGEKKSISSELNTRIEAQQSRVQKWLRLAVFMVTLTFLGNFFLPGGNGILLAQKQSLQLRTKSFDHDTARIRNLYDTALDFYFDAEPDSCQKFASMAVSLANEVIGDQSRDAVAYKPYCKLFRAQSMELIGTALYSVKDQAALDTFEKAMTFWEETEDSSGIADCHLSIAEIYSDRTDYNRALQHYRAALDLYRQAGNYPDLGLTYFYIGLNQRYMGNLGDALESNLSSLQIGKEIGDTNLITTVLLSNGFLLLNDSSQALKYQREALDLYVRQNDSAGIATAYNDIGVTYMVAGNLGEALKNHQQALSIRKRLNEHTFTSSSYSYISQILQNQGKFQLALTQVFEALKYSKLAGGDYEIDGYMEAGRIYHKMGDSENALKYFQTAAKISEERNIPQRQAEAYQGIAEVFLLEERHNEAVLWLRKAEEIAAEDDFVTRQFIYLDLTNAYVTKRDYRGAYESQLKFKEMSDSATTREKNEKIATLIKQLEFENLQALQKASQDKQLAVQQAEIERQKVVRNFSMAGLFFVILLALIFFIRFKEKGKLNIALEGMLANLKATQSQLIHSEKMASLGELTAGIAHEIQNPLNFVNNFSEVSQELIDEMTEEIKSGDMNESLSLASSVKQNLAKIQHHGQRADAIVKGMLMHSRTTSGQRQPTDINALCDEYLQLAYHGFRAKDKQFNAEIITDFDPDLPAINVLPQDIGRVLLNLLNNAFQACTAKALVTADQQNLSNYHPLVSIMTKLLPSSGTREVHAGGVAITISDNGPGIPDDIKDKIFQPFFTTKPTGQGTGLGLSISYDIIKNHGGALKVESEENVGSLFIITLPRLHP